MNFTVILVIWCFGLAFSCSGDGFGNFVVFGLANVGFVVLCFWVRNCGFLGWYKAEILSGLLISSFSWLGLSCNFGGFAILILFPVVQVTNLATWQFCILLFGSC